MLIDIKNIKEYNIFMNSDRSIEISRNIELVNDQIAEAALNCGRSASDIKLMAVSKTKPVEDIISAYEAGQRLFGENRIQEAAEKFSKLPDDAEMHMIGHLQSNKAKTAAECASCVQSIDKLATASELNKRALSINRKLDILVEINTSGELSKSGYQSFNLFLKDLPEYMRLENLRLRGLMTIAPFTEDETMIHRSFASLYSNFCKLQNEIDSHIIDTLSMGMSSDYRIAVEEGSTLIRVGTAIFGSRNY